VLDVDFLGFGSEEKLCPIFRCSNKCLDCVFGHGMTKICSPKWKGGPLVGKNLEQTLITLITKHVSSYERGVNNWNMDKFWPLIKWDGNEIYWINYEKRFTIHLLLKSMFTKKWKNLWSYKNLCFLTLNFHTTPHTTLGLRRPSS
jgi:hypothetical protein